MNDKNFGKLSITLKKNEIVRISDGTNLIEIRIRDRYRQPIACRVQIKSSKQYQINRIASEGDSE